MSCPTCKTDVSNAKNTVKCVECSSVYHATCCRIRTVAKLTSMSARTLATWKCDDCAQDTASIRSDPEDSKVTDILLAIQRDISASKEATKQGFSTINLQLTKLNETLAELNNKLSAVEAENAALKVECTELRTENKILATKVNNLEREIGDIQQYSRNRNVELLGIPITKNEDVYEILSSVAGALGVPYNRNDISVAHRLPAPKGKTPSIVAQFISRSTRAVWINMAKQKKIQTTDLAASLRPSPVFVVEHLTPQNRRLLGYAKACVREQLLAFAWSREGKIFVRKTADAPARRVFTSNDVDGVARPERGGGEGERRVSGGVQGETSTTIGSSSK
jgi:hypothetical protein